MKDSLIRAINLYARQLSDAEKARIQATNRLERANACGLCGGKDSDKGKGVAVPKKDHECTLSEPCVQGKPCKHCDGIGLVPEEQRLAPERLTLMTLFVESAKKSEKFLEKALTSQLKEHRYGQLVLDTPGLGLKGAGRLLGIIGDFSRFPSPSHLWSYMGLGVNDGQRVRRVRGEVAHFNPDGQPWAFNAGEAIVKTKGPYRDLYDRRKEYTHEHRPEWTDGHCHNDAKRIAVKQMLQELWCRATGNPIIEDAREVA